MLLASTLRIETVIQKTPKPFNNLGDYKDYKDQLQIKYDGDHLVFTGFLTEFYNPPSDETTRSEYGNGSDFLIEIKEYQGEKCFVPTRRKCFL